MKKKSRISDKKYNWIPIPGMMFCSTCKQVKPESELCASGHKKSPNNRVGICKSCRSARSAKWRVINGDRDKEKRQILYYKQRKYIKKLYGITKEEYEQMSEKQKHLCSICKNYCDTLRIDHDHILNRIRGLLCNKCNLGIGLLGDSIAGVERALIYLKENS